MKADALAQRDLERGGVYKLPRGSESRSDITLWRDAKEGFINLVGDRERKAVKGLLRVEGRRLVDKAVVSSCAATMEMTVETTRVSSRVRVNLRM